MKKLCNTLLLILFTVFCFNSYSQYTTTGTDFWVSFHENFGTDANPILYITSDVGATGTVSIPGTGWTQNFTVGVNASVNVNLPANSAIIYNTNTVLNRGVRVTSSTPIAVYAANQRNASSDATLVLPTHALGDTYIVNTYSTFSSYSSQFVVVGVEDNTSIEIIPSANLIGGVGAGVPFSITLNEGQVYFVQSMGDLTGTIVRATSLGVCNDFAVFAGNRCANVPLSCQYCDHLYEQMIPTKAWGQEYITVPLMTRNGDQYRIMAYEDNTTVNINGGANISLNATDFHEVYLQPSSHIVADKPISVAQYSRGTTCDGVTSDPFMIMLSPIEQTLDYIVFQAFSTNVINQFYTNIVTKTAHTGQVLLNGATIPNWTTVPSNPQYSYARRSIAQGTYVLESPEGILATVYGFGNADSYGYQAGANIQPLNVSFDIIIDGEPIAFDVFQDSLNCQQSINGVDFTTDSPNIIDVHWDFGDGNTATGTSVHHSFPTPGWHTVTMHFTRIESCVEESISMDIFINSLLPPFDFINDTIICNGSPFTIYPGASDVNYLWQDNSTNSTYHVTQSGTYSVTISDDFGCTASATADVEFINFSLSTQAQNITCAGMSDGSVTVNTNGGSAPFEYYWSTVPPQTTQTISNLGEGTYHVTVTENNGCSAVASANIVDPEDFVGSISNLQNVSCYGAGDGSVTINVQGGIPPYGINWDSSQVNGFNPQNLQPGTYSFTVSDVNNCTYENSVVITQPNQITVTETLNSAACHGQPINATVNVQGGTSPHSITWQNGTTSFNNSNITANTDFGYTVTDANNCTYTGYVYVEEPDPMIIAANITDVTCKGDADGKISITVSGSTEPYEITWSSGQDTTHISDLAAAFYTVTVTDANNCTGVETFQVAEADQPLNLTFEINHVKCHGEYQGAILMDATGGIPPYSFRLGTGAYELGGNSHSGLAGGQYNFRVIDNNGCEVNRSAIINEPSPIEIDINAVRPSCIGNNDGYIEIFVAGGTEPYYYSFNNEYYDINIFNNLREGDYVVEVVDFNNCKYGENEIKLVDIQVDCITVPSAFTPNGDGINDTWIIDNIEMFPSATIDVFNRWGQEVFKARGNDEPWDGKYNGKLLPTGSYMYVINLRNGTKEYTGTVTIVY